MLRRLVDLQYARNDVNLVRGTFRARGDTVEIHPAYEEQALRIEMFGDTVDRIVPFDVITGEMGDEIEDVAVYAATHYVTGDDIIQRAVGSIEAELRERLQYFEKEGKLLEAQRLRVRTEHDLEMLAETGVCSGVENYSRHLDGRAPGETPFTLLDFFPKDYLCVIDESHVAVPQLHGQYAGDRSRKDMLVEHGFRLPSARDNRPLRFEEFIERVPQCVFVSATPGAFELEHSAQVVEQVIRPTGPRRPRGDDHAHQGAGRRSAGRGSASTVEAGGRVLVTTLTKKMAEDLTDYLADAGVRVQYLHSDIDTITRIEILRELRLGLHRRPGRHQPAAGGARPARGGARRHPRCGQGGLPALGLLAHPDDGPGRPQRRRHGRALRRHGHRLHARGGLGHPAPPRGADRLQQGARHRPPDHPQVGDRHPRAPARVRRRGASAKAGRSRAEVRKNAAVRGNRRPALLADGDASTPAEAIELMTQLEAEMKAAAAELRYEEAALLRDEIADLRALRPQLSRPAPSRRRRRRG